MDRDVLVLAAEQFRLANEAFVAAVEAKTRAEAAVQDAYLAEARAQRALQEARHALLNVAADDSAPEGV